LTSTYIADPSIRSRFKRGFEITNSIQDLSGIIKLFRFDEGRMIYEMEKGDYPLFRLVQYKELAK
jgi:eukaryotic-like serine/threonine-protein kinase